MIKYKHCGSEELRKDWVVKGKQLYKCKHTTRDNDQMYSMNKRII